MVLIPAFTTQDFWWTIEGLTRELLDEMASGNVMEEFQVVRDLKPIRHAFRQRMWQNLVFPPPNEFLSLQWRQESDGHESPTILQFELEYIKDQMSDEEQQNLIDCCRHLFHSADDPEPEDEADEEIVEFCKMICFDIPLFRRNLEVDSLSSPEGSLEGSLGGTPPPDLKLPGSPPRTPPRTNIYTVRLAYPDPGGY